jgi:hypothetical protein
MIFQDDRRVPESVFMVKIAPSRPLKRVTVRILRISKYFMEASKKFLTNITTVSSSKHRKPSAHIQRVLI